MFSAPRSLTRRTLWRIALAAGLGIVLATVATYTIIYDAMEKVRLELLTQYVVERAQREESRFLIAESNHQVLKEVFEQRLRDVQRRDDRAWFDSFIEQTPDGAWRSIREKVDPSRQPSTWIRAGTNVTDATRRLVRLSHEICEQYFHAWRAQVASLYVSSPLQFNTGVAPPLPNWVWEIAADFDQNAHEWGRLGGPVANPERASLWTGILFDVSAPQGVRRGAFVTLCTPVDVDGQHLLTLHHDVFFEQLLDHVLLPERPGVTHALFRDDGRLIAEASLWDELVATDGNLMLTEERTPLLHHILQEVRQSGSSLMAGYNGTHGVYFAASRLRGPGWWFVSLLPRAQVQAEAFGSAQWVLWIGLATLAAVLAALAWILQREIARPLGGFLQATRHVATGRLQPGPGGHAIARVAFDELVGMRADTEIRTALNRPDELGQLAAAFYEMMERIADREAARQRAEDELRALNQSLEQRIRERTVELSESEARLRTLFNHSPIAIVTLDAETGRFIEGNQHALRLLGVGPEMVAQSGPADLSPAVQPDGRPSAEAARDQIARVLDGEVRIFDWVHRGPSGREVPCEVHLARLPATGRQLLVATLMDLTLRKQTEAELLRALERERELGQLKSDFVSMVSHEFRTPLEVILTSSDILDRYFERIEPPRRRQQLEAIQRSVRRMAEMMESVLLLSRVEAGTVRYQPAPLDLSQWCRRLVDEIESATNHSCPLEIELRPEVTEVWADPVLLHHIFSNLLSNAVKYSEPGSPVRWVIEREGAHAVFRVEDRGRGIPEADCAQLFRAFHRGRNVGQVAGTGLGLVIVKRCVDLHGGRIRCESREGAGTTFIVTLPLFVPPGGSSDGRSTGARLPLNTV